MDSGSVLGLEFGGLVETSSEFGIVSSSLGGDSLKPSLVSLPSPVLPPASPSPAAADTNSSKKRPRRCDVVADADNKPFACTEPGCNKRYLKKGGLTCHVRTKHEEPRRAAQESFRRQKAAKEAQDAQEALEHQKAAELQQVLAIEPTFWQQKCEDLHQLRWALSTTLFELEKQRRVKQAEFDKIQRAKAAAKGQACFDHQLKLQRAPKLARELIATLIKSIKAEMVYVGRRPGVFQVVVNDVNMETLQTMYSMCETAKSIRRDDDAALEVVEVEDPAVFLRRRIDNALRCGIEQLELRPGATTFTFDQTKNTLTLEGHYYVLL